MDWHYEITEDMKEIIKKLFPLSIFAAFQDINDRLLKQKAKYRKKYGSAWETAMFTAHDYDERELNGYLLLNLYSKYIVWLVGAVKVSHQDKFGDYMTKGKFENLWEEFLETQKEGK